MFIYQTEKRLKYYEQVIEIYKQTGYSSRRIEKLGMVPVSRECIRKWIANFVAENGKVSPMTVMQEPQVTISQAQSEEMEQLKKRVKELEAQLLRAEIKAEFYDEMINVAEAKFRIPIRKKAGAKQ